MAAGEDVCACSPSTYEFTFDFDLTCPPPGTDNPEGIAEVTCFITSFSAEVKDLVPVIVRSISIIEADTGRIPIAQSQVDGNFVTGDSFTYASVSALGNSTQLPQSIQLTITGTNAENSSLVQVWAIKFTNDCNVYPVLEVGQSYGWTTFVSLSHEDVEWTGRGGYHSSIAHFNFFVNTGINRRIWEHHALKFALPHLITA